MNNSFYMTWNNADTNEVLLFHWCTYASLNGVIIGSGNGLSPIRRQTITWTNADSLSIEPLGTNFSEILIKIQTFSLTSVHLKIASAKCWPSCPILFFIAE